MDLSIELRKGEQKRTISVSSGDVTISSPQKVEKRESGDNDRAIEIALEMKGAGWIIDNLLAMRPDVESLSSVLAKIPVARSLTLRSAGEAPLASLDVLAAWKGVRHLELTDLHKGISLAPLAKLAGLESLSLSAKEPESALAALPELPSVTKLELCTVDAIDAVLTKVPALRSLTLYGGRPRDLSWVTTRKLESLHLADVSDPDGKALSLEAIAGLRDSLRALQINGGELSDTAAISELADLTSLVLYSIAIEPAALTKLGKLTTLELRRAGLPDLRALSKMLSLESLEYHDAVSDLGPLASLASLRNLVLLEGKLADLAPLAGLPLETLTLPDGKLKAPAVKPLLKNTKVRIDWDNRTWSSKDLHGFFAGTFKLPTMKDAMRSAFPFKTKKGKPGVLDSHIGGSAYLAQGEKWPVCGNCKRPMPLFVQIDLADLELAKTLKGMLQFFYCNATDPQCEVVLESWKGTNAAMLLRIVQPAKKAAALEPPEFPSPIVAKTLELAKPKQDSPFPEDAQALYGIRDAADRCVSGDKAAGWPAWLQDPEWPECADCKTPMTHVLQLESNKGVPHQWGDVGRAWLFACAQHPAQTGFCWQSG